MGGGRSPADRDRRPRRSRLERLLTGALLACTIALCLFLFGVPRPPEADRRASEAIDPASVSASLVARVWRLLAPADPDLTFVVEERAQAIADLGPETLAVVVGILFGEIRIPEELGRGPSEWEVEFWGEAIDGFDRRATAFALQRDVLFAALRLSPVSDVLAHARARAEPGRPLDSRLLAARLLGEAGDARALEVLLAIASSLEPVELATVRSQRSIEQPLARLLAREPLAARALEGELERLDPALLGIVVRSLSASGSHRSLALLGRMLGRDPELDLQVVEAIAEAASAAIKPPSDALLERVRALLHDRDLRLRRAAARALSELHDPEACPELALLVADEDRMLARTAHASLQQMAGVRIGPESGPWLAWLEKEAVWWESEGQLRLEQLESEDAGTTAAAIAVLLRHRLQRHEIATAIAPLVTSERSPVAEAALAALEQLGSPRAVPWLALACDDAEEPWRGKVLACVRSLAGRACASEEPLAAFAR